MIQKEGKLVQTLDLLDNGGGYFNGCGLSTEIGCQYPRLAYALDTLHQLVGSTLLADPLEHLCCGPECRDRVRDTFTRDVEGGSVDGLEHTGVLAARVEVRCGRNTDRACKGSGKIGKNIGMLCHTISILSTETRRMGKGAERTYQVAGNNGI